MFQQLHQLLRCFFSNPIALRCHLWWRNQQPAYLFMMPDRATMVEEFFHDLRSAIDFVRRTLPENEHEYWLMEVWKPVGWLNWWTDLIPFEYRYGLTKTLYDGQPYNGWETIITQCFTQGVPSVRGRRRLPRPEQRTAFRLLARS